MVTHFSSPLPGRPPSLDFLHCPLLSSRSSRQFPLVDPATILEPHVILFTVGTSLSLPDLTYQPPVYLSYQPTKVSTHGTLGVNIRAYSCHVA